MLPHRQLDDVIVAISYLDGTVDRIERLGGALAVDWSPHGHAAFAVPRRGRDVAALAIGFRGRNADSALRYVKALPAPAFAQQAANFQLVLGLFLGTVGSALIYNLFIGGGFRQSFQGIYTIWGSLALLNGLLASGLLTGLWPALLGSAGIIANRMVLALLFASGILFLLALIERGLVPRALVRLSLVTAAAIAATAPLALAEGWLPPGLYGRATSLLMALNIVVIIVVATVAVGRGSRAAWFYLAGWAPILAFGLVLIAFESGLIAHSQLIDLGGMLALAFESVVFSLAMADRFRRLQLEHDALESTRVVAEAERVALRQVADTDQLTGLSNRRAFDAPLAAARTGEIDRLALILIDVDHFKSINDRFGHEEGDDLLREIANRLRTSVRTNDVVARLGGDEFAILLTGSDAQHADQVIRGLLAAQSHAARLERKVTFSIGAALLPDDDADPANLYKNADLALYEAKRLGRARAQRYRPALRTHEQQRLAVGLKGLICSSQR
jgi:diguanylate cyclase (GGDEF)-like protein